MPTVHGKSRNSSERLLDLVNLYLDSFFTEYEGTLFLQQEGVCVGSCIASVLSDMYSAQLNQCMETQMRELLIAACFRYVDDYLLCAPMNNGKVYHRMKLWFYFNDTLKGWCSHMK